MFEQLGAFIVEDVQLGPKATADKDVVEFVPGFFDGGGLAILDGFTAD